jgi:hypothetical protein
VVIAAGLSTRMSGSNEREFGAYQGLRTVSDPDA